MEDDEVIDAVLQAGDPFASTPEIADQEIVTLSRRGLHNRLVALAEGGKIARKEVGNTTVWWVPREDGPAVTAGDVYTDGGVAQRVDSLDENIDRLADTVTRLEGVVKDLADETEQTRETVGDVESAVRSLVPPGVLMVIGVAVAAVEGVIGAPDVVALVGGLALVGGAVWFCAEAVRAYLSK